MIFEDEEDDDTEDDGDDGEAPATHAPSTSTTTTTVQDGPSPTPPTIQQYQVEAAAEAGGGGLFPGERHRGALKLIIHPQESLVTSMSVRHGRGPEMHLTLLIQLLLLPLSRKTLDMHYLILIG
jgi:hypothetical protein